MSISFEWLLAPYRPEQFFRDFYEREPLLIEGKGPARFAALLSVAAIDQFLATSSPCFPDVFLVDAARELKPEDYTVGSGTAPDLINLAKAYQLFGSGATITINHLHERNPQLAALCRAMERTFSAHFQTNIYLSPPNAQGFKTHFDGHDVFVIQVAGSKIWTLYDTLIEKPLQTQPFLPDKHIAGPPTRELTLNAGDLFYCPRGLFHSARSTDEISLHITLGMIGKTWADVLTEALSQACLDSPEFRAHLPVGYANLGFDAAGAEATFRSLIERFASSVRLEPILSRFADDFVTSRRPNLAGCLQELDRAPEVSADSRLVARPDLLVRLREEGEDLAIVLGPAELKLPSFTRQAVAHALSGRPFRVRDLDGELDEPGKLVLVRRLIREGLLVRSAGPGEG